MMNPVRELKVRAEILHHAVGAGDIPAIERLRILPELRKADPATLREAVSGIRRKHCLAVVGREVGFTGWEHARRVLDGDSDGGGETDFGKLLSPPTRATFLNHWFSTYDEAHAVHRELSSSGARRYLLVYQRQFFVTECGYVEALGLDPDDPDWRAMGWDWARPERPLARRRLYAKLLAPRPDQRG
jgi:hypothetical protein